jgi:GH15 family glucan-1,4-alpha-glucosidase
MHDPDPPFRPIRRVDGYLRLEDYGLIGDGATAALVGVDGSIPWLCIPRFDAEPLFCGLLDHASGGSFTIAPGWSCHPRIGAARRPLDHGDQRSVPR